MEQCGSSSLPNIYFIFHMYIFMCIYILFFIYIYIFLNLKTGFHHIGQADLELPNSGDPPALASKVLGLQAWIMDSFFFFLIFMKRFTNFRVILAKGPC